MHRVNISIAKASFSRCVELAKSGETVVVVDRRRPVAVIKGIDLSLLDDHLGELVVAGLVRPPEVPLDVGGFFALPGAVFEGSLRDQLADERAGR